MWTHNDIATESLDELSINVKILKVIRDFKKLIIGRIDDIAQKPDLNRQIDNFVNALKLFARSYHPAPLTRVTPQSIGSYREFISRKLQGAKILHVIIWDYILQSW